MTAHDRIAASIRRTTRAILDEDAKRAQRLQAWLNGHLRRRDHLHDKLDAARDRKRARLDAAVERMLNPFR